MRLNIDSPSEWSLYERAWQFTIVVWLNETHFLLWEYPTRPRDPWEIDKYVKEKKHLCLENYTISTMDQTFVFLATSVVFCVPSFSSKERRVPKSLFFKFLIEILASSNMQREKVSHHWRTWKYFFFKTSFFSNIYHTHFSLINVQFMSISTLNMQQTFCKRMCEVRIVPPVRQSKRSQFKFLCSARGWHAYGGSQQNSLC